MAYKTLTLSMESPTATIALTRPQELNHVDRESASEIREALKLAAEDNAVKVIILTGTAEVFSAGPSLSSELPKGEDDLNSLKGLLHHLQVAREISHVEKPLLAAINGPALNHGMEIALSCDIRIASPEAKFGFPEVKEGLIPWDGGTQRLPRLIGKARALELLLTGREIGAHEAYNIGLITEVVPKAELLDRAKSLAIQISGQGPVALRYVKEAALKGLDLTLEQGLRLEADLYFILHSTIDRAEGIRSFLEKRKPQFKGE